MTGNRPSDALDQRRNSFGLLYPGTIHIFGTRGDVETFFLVLNDLIADGVLEDRYQTISYDLYRTFVNKDNMQIFNEEVVRLEYAYSKISSAQVKWERYPFNRVIGKYDYERCSIQPSMPTLLNIFGFFFLVFNKAYYWLEHAITTPGYKNPRIMVGPSEILSGTSHKELSDEQIISSADHPIWLR